MYTLLEPREEFGPGTIKIQLLGALASINGLTRSYGEERGFAETANKRVRNAY